MLENTRRDLLRRYRLDPAKVETVPLGVGPILFGVFTMGWDMLFIGMKHLFKRIVADAKNSVR